jgi:hypothetical protein
MKIAPALLLAMVLSSTMATAAVREEHVTGGSLDLVWAPGFGVTANMRALTLDPSHPAYNNPSGDHTVADATNMPPDSGGIILTATEPAGLRNYSWEGWIFTGAGDTRRGLVVRANPDNRFESNYQFVIQSGLFQLSFRKLVDSTPTTLRSWFATSLPDGSIAANTWYRMKVSASCDQFRVWFDDFELTSAADPIVDGELTSGWVGVYNFRFDLGGVPFLTDDLLLNPEPGCPTNSRTSTWGHVKTRYR